MDTKLTTAVFVDFDTWFWQSHNNHCSNQIGELFNTIKQNSTIVSLAIHGDFSKDIIKDEKQKLENRYPRMVHDCGKYNLNIINTNKKDLTDFYLLDDMYQTLYSNPSVGQFILIAGDGHFHGALAHIKMFHQKKIGIYSLRGSINPLLKEIADWYIELEYEHNFDLDSIFDNLYNNEISNYYSYFNNTIDNLSKIKGNEKTILRRALSYLISQKYIDQTKIKVDGHGERSVLLVNWEKVEKEKLWSRPLK